MQDKREKIFGVLTVVATAGFVFFTVLFLGSCGADSQCPACKDTKSPPSENQCPENSCECNNVYNSPIEVCDGMDNDANGLVDEGDPNLGADCVEMVNVNGGWIPVEGRLYCGYHDYDQSAQLMCTIDNIPGLEYHCEENTEFCDGIDNNCNFQVDEDCVICIPREEICNEVDDDCDGEIDESDPRLQEPCFMFNSWQGVVTPFEGMLLCIPNPEIWAKYEKIVYELICMPTF